VITALFADVKGSTALAERIDTETWVEIMNHVLQVLTAEIHRYGGEVDRYEGDGLVAFFGVPTAHEDDAERAVLAALAMQEAVARYAAELKQDEGIELLLRIGLNTARGGPRRTVGTGGRARHGAGQRAHLPPCAVPL
jgi:adenylate cyclase